jgi:hypothetical protein
LILRQEDMPEPRQTPVQDLLTRFPLRRIITSNRFIPEVDGFRFLAIVLVIIAHIYVQRRLSTLHLRRASTEFISSLRLAGSF